MKMPRFSAKDSRDFTIERRGGNENVASKMNLRFFGLYRDYPNSLTLSNVGEPPRSWISKNHIQGLDRAQNFDVACLRPP